MMNKTPLNENLDKIAELLTGVKGTSAEEIKSEFIHRDKPTKLEKIFNVETEAGKQKEEEWLNKTDFMG